MNRIENNNQLTIYNPYRDQGALQPSAVSAIAQKTLQKSFVERVLDWSKGRLYRDYERHLEILDTGTWLLNKGVVVVVGGMQAAVIADGLFQLNLVKNGIFSFFPAILKLVLAPASIFFLIIGMIESIFEIINLKRAVELFKSVKKEKNPLDGLEFIKAKYFTLETEETQKIYEMIEEKLPDADPATKADRFDQIAKRALEIKFENLKRRITPGLADEVKVQLHSIMKDLQSPDAAVQSGAQRKAKHLMDSVSTQAKNKIIIHVLGILAIFFTVLSAIGMISGVGSAGFFIAMGVCTAAAVILKWIVQKRAYEKEVEKFYDKITTPFEQTKAVATS